LKLGFRLHLTRFSNYCWHNDTIFWNVYLLFDENKIRIDNSQASFGHHFRLVIMVIYLWPARGVIQIVFTQIPKCITLFTSCNVPNINNPPFASFCSFFVKIHPIYSTESFGKKEAYFVVKLPSNTLQSARDERIRCVWVVGAHLCVRPGCCTVIAHGELSGFYQGRHIGRPLRDRAIANSRHTNL